MNKGILILLTVASLLFSPTLLLGQSMGGKGHGMMSGEEAAGGMMGSTAGQRMPYKGSGGYGGGVMMDCPMTGSPMMGHGMMGHGMMRGPGMSGMGYGAHPMMGGFGMGMCGGHPWASTRMSSFLDETRQLRREMHDLRFEYMEKMRHPETTIGELQKMQDRLGELQQELWSQYRSQ